MWVSKVISHLQLYCDKPAWQSKVLMLNQLYCFLKRRNVMKIVMFFWLYSWVIMLYSVLYSMKLLCGHPPVLLLLPVYLHTWSVFCAEQPPNCPRKYKVFSLKYSRLCHQFRDHAIPHLSTSRPHWVFRPSQSPDLPTSLRMPLSQSASSFCKLRIKEKNVQQLQQSSYMLHTKTYHPYNYVTFT